jgi:hypothetical protein
MLLIIISGLLFNAVLFKVVLKRLSSIEEKSGISFKKRFHTVLQLLLPLVLVMMTAPPLPIPAEMALTLRHFSELGTLKRDTQY